MTTISSSAENAPCITRQRVSMISTFSTGKQARRMLL